MPRTKEYYIENGISCPVILTIKPWLKVKGIFVATSTSTSSLLIKVLEEISRNLYGWTGHSENHNAVNVIWNKNYSLENGVHYFWAGVNETVEFVFPGDYKPSPHHSEILI